MSLKMFYGTEIKAKVFHVKKEETVKINKRATTNYCFTQSIMENSWTSLPSILWTHEIFSYSRLKLFFLLNWDWVKCENEAENKHWRWKIRRKIHKYKVFFYLLLLPQTRKDWKSKVFPPISNWIKCINPPLTISEREATFVKISLSISTLFSFKLFYTQKIHGE